MGIYTEVLKDTFNYYAEDPSRRAIEWTDEALGHTSCHYFLHEEGTVKMCAVGRLLEHPEECEDLLMSVETLVEIEGKSVFKPEYRGLSVDFLSELQNWHDDNANFTDTGVSSGGKYFFDKIYSKWSD